MLPLDLMKLSFSGYLFVMHFAYDNKRGEMLDVIILLDVMILTARCDNLARCDDINYTDNCYILTS